MATNRHLIRRSRRGDLTHEQEMELWLGPSHRGSAFGSESERVAAWLKHRDRLMEVFATHGTRPDGWWRYESPIPRPRGDTERSALWAAGLLDPDERIQLESWWREQFQRAWSPDFFHTEAPGRIFQGAAARYAHYKWADIPRALVRKWTLERRRRARAIRKLEDAAGQPTPA